jgi:AP-1 complex subunit gamma-1
LIGDIVIQVLDHIPPLEETAYDASLEPAEPAAAGTAAAAANGGSAAADLAALLGLDAGMSSAQPVPGMATGPAAPASQADAVGALSDLLAGDLLGSNGTAAQPVAAAAPAGAAAAAADPLADIFGAPGTALPAASAATPAQTITAFAKGPLTIEFRLEKQPGSPALTDITASVSNSGAAALEGFTLQAAVPKAMQLRLEPASAAVVPPHSSGSVTQRLHVTNTLHGQKPLVMRLRISYSLGGQQVLEQCEVSSFPPGY